MLSWKVKFLLQTPNRWKSNIQTVARYLFSGPCSFFFLHSLSSSFFLYAWSIHCLQEPDTTGWQEWPGVIQGPVFLPLTPLSITLDRSVVPLPEHEQWGETHPCVLWLPACSPLPFDIKIGADFAYQSCLWYIKKNSKYSKEWLKLSKVHTMSILNSFH